MSGKEAMMEGTVAGRQRARPKKADAPAASDGEAQTAEVEGDPRSARSYADPSAPGRRLWPAPGCRLVPAGLRRWDPEEQK